MSTPATWACQWGMFPAMCWKPRMVKNLKRFEKAGFLSHNFLAQLLSETPRACTIRVRRSSLGRLWNDLGSHAGLHHRIRRPGTSTEERISGRREPDPESPNQRQVVVIRCRKSYVGGDRPPARTESPWKNWRLSPNRLRCFCAN